MRKLNDDAVGVVALYISDDDMTEVTYLSTSSTAETEKVKAQELEQSGYKLDYVVVTNCADTFYRARLKSILAQFRWYSYYSQKYLEGVKETLSDEVYQETERLAHEVEQVFITRTAMRTKRVLALGDEVTDELALQCLDWYNNQCSEEEV